MLSGTAAWRLSVSGPSVLPASQITALPLVHVVCYFIDSWSCQIYNVSYFLVQPATGEFSPVLVQRRTGNLTHHQWCIVNDVFDTENF